MFAIKKKGSKLNSKRKNFAPQGYINVVNKSKDFSIISTESVPASIMPNLNRLIALAGTKKLIGGTLFKKEELPQRIKKVFIYLFEQIRCAIINREFCSWLCLGPNVCDKILLIKSIEFELRNYFNVGPLKVEIVHLSCFHLLGSNPKSILKYIISQFYILDPEFEHLVTSKEVCDVAFIITMLQRLNSHAKYIVFIFDGIEKLTSSHFRNAKDTFLYLLLNQVHYEGSQMCILGTSLAFNAIELLKNRLKSRISNRTINLTWIKNINEIKEEILSILRIKTKNAMLQTALMISTHVFQKFQKGISMYERCLSPALESVSLANVFSQKDKSLLTFDELLHLQATPDALSKICLVAFQYLSISTTKVIKPDFIMKGLFELSQAKKAATFMLSSFPTLWLILLGGMERLHSFRNKTTFTFINLHEECMESLFTTTCDLMYKFKKKTALNAFSQLLSMNLCQYVYDLEEENPIQTRTVKLIVHGDVIMSAIQKRFIHHDAFLDWVTGRGSN
jgi:hypothetical protein